MRSTQIQFRLLFIGLIICLLVPISIVSCAGGTSAPSTTSSLTTTPKPTGPQYGGTLRWAIQSDAVSPGYPPEARNYTPFGAVIETLLRYDSKSDVVPWLAESYKVDTIAKTITLSLKKGVKFHDGTDFNAEAVKWNLDDRVKAKMSGMTLIKSIDVIDDYTVRLNLMQWDNALLTRLAYMPGMIVSPTAYNKNGKEWAASNPVGTGPFEFASWQKSAKTTVKKFPNYWQKNKPYVDTIDAIFMENELTREISFKAKELDVLITMESRSLGDFRKNGFTVKSSASGCGANCIIPSSANANSPLANLKVRQAMAYAIDSAAIAKAIYSGEVPATNQWSSSGNWAYCPDVKGYPYDPQKAKQLLTEAGYPNGLKTSIIFQNIQRWSDTYAAVQGFFKAVGIDMELKPMEYNAMSTLLYTGKEWEGLASGHPSSDPDTLAEMVRRLTGTTGYYKSMMNPADFVQALQNAVVAPDFQTKQKFMWEAQKLLIDKYCILIPLYENRDFVINHPNVHNTGFRDNPNAYYWTPEEVWLDKK